MSSLLQRLRGSLVIAAALRGQRQAPFLDRTRLDALRDRRTRETVVYAARHVPFYREWMAAAGVSPSDIRTAGDLARLPLLDRDEVRREPRRFLSTHPQARHALSFLTSGTSGTPLEVHHDQRSLLRNIAWGEREREPVNRACGGFRPKEVYVGYETSTFKKVTAFYQDSVLFPVKPRRRFVSLRTPIDDVVRIINEERPDVLVGYGGWLDHFFRTAAARALEVHRPTVVMYMGEALPIGGRRFIEDTVGARVMSRYNAVESFKIGYFCEQGDTFHVHEDLCHLRIVDAHGSDVSPGRTGRIVLSNLVNRATVLLNYPIGDMAAMPDHSCTCGRTFRLLSELDGRTEDLIALPGDRFVHPRSVWQQFKDEHDVIQYQLVQLEIGRFELTLVTLEAESCAAALTRLLPRLRALLGDDIVIDTHHRTETVRADGSKYRAVASRVRAAP